jgi:trehalose synthase
MLAADKVPAAGFLRTGGLHVLQSVAVPQKRLADYSPIVDPALLAEIASLAAPLRGRRVVHLSATAFRGGVAEILHTLVPLMSDVGLTCDWQVIYGREDFYAATKRIADALQGGSHLPTADQWETWRHYSEMNARELTRGWDVCVVHDPQPVAIYQLASAKARQWVWSCHADLSAPDPQTLGALLPELAGYPASVFHVKRYVPAGLRGSVSVIAPGIDPLAPKNLPMSTQDAGSVCRRFGIDPGRPLLCQVSRFDPWKDPVGVIDAYRLIKAAVPAVQLALVGSVASDDSSGREYYERTLAHAAGDPDVLIITNHDNVGDVEVAAFQALADIVIQKSTREGFGLTVSEALWKARPVVASDVGGIPLQVRDGRTGHLVSTVEACAERCLEILRNPRAGAALGRAGREHVRANFLMPRYLRDYLRLFNEVLADA